MLSSPNVLPIYESSGFSESELTALDAYGIIRAEIEDGVAKGSRSRVKNVDHNDAEMVIEVEARKSKSSLSRSLGSLSMKSAFVEGTFPSPKPVDQVGVKLKKDGSLVFTHTTSRREVSRWRVSDSEDATIEQLGKGSNPTIDPLLSMQSMVRVLRHNESADIDDAPPAVLQEAA